MRHRVYVNEQLQPAEFDDAVDYTILDALGRANIDYESHCCMGWCGTCRVVLVSGQVRYPGGKPLVIFVMVKFCLAVVFQHQILK